MIRACVKVFCTHIQSTYTMSRRAARRRSTVGVRRAAAPPLAAGESFTQARRRRRRARRLVTNAHVVENDAHPGAAPRRRQVRRARRLHRARSRPRAPRRGRRRLRGEAAVGRDRRLRPERRDARRRAAAPRRRCRPSASRSAATTPCDARHRLAHFGRRHRGPRRPNRRGDQPGNPGGLLRSGWCPRRRRLSGMVNANSIGYIIPLPVLHTFVDAFRRHGAYHGKCPTALRSNRWRMPHCAAAATCARGCRA